jgi:queuine tRNA-ribosyltransferase
MACSASSRAACYPDLRAELGAALTAIGFDGYAVGGLAVGEGQEAMFAVLEATVPHLPADRPRYLMGVGKPADIVGAVARHRHVRLRAADPLGAHRPGLHAARGAEPDERPPPRRPAATRPRLPLPGLRRLSRAYLHHLFKAKEMLVRSC